ncbi:MAG: hypothetical protein KDB80_15675 [Planctomycetes bacterium]|nr:hypothetical protein [Planctomycetota bacterium]
MPSRDLFVELTAALEAQDVTLRELIADMRARRMSFVSARPSTIETSMSSLERLQRQASERDSVRCRLAADLAESLGLARDSKLRELIRRAPRAMQPRMQRAADAIAATAKQIQVESRVGQRLLDFSRACHEGFVQDLCGIVKNQAAGGYDRNARSKGAAVTSGNLISGTV